MRWKVVLYKKANGICPVEDYLKKLQPGHRAKAMREIDLLEEFGVSLQRPHVAAIRTERYSGLQELRIQFAGDASRILYFLHQGEQFILLHGFMKKTDSLPEKELEIARKRKEEYLGRSEG